MAILVNKFLFGQDVSDSIPSNWYIGMLKNKLDPSEFNGDITDKEVTNKGYSRVKIPNNDEYFSILTSSSAQMSYVTNKYDIAFPIITGDGNTPIYGFFLSDTESNNIAYIWGNLDTARTAYQNTQVVIRAGALSFSVSNTEGSGTISQGLVVNDDGIMSGNVGVTALGTLL